LVGTLKDFREYRERMNRRILESDNLQIKQFFNLDWKAYRPDALDVKTKELLGLVASTVLRCDDCIAYHVIRCSEEKISEPQFLEAMNIALIVGGSITIPHLRRAVEMWDECKKAGREDSHE